MAIQPKNIVQEFKSLFAGIDVGAEELILVIRKNGTPYKPQKFANTPADRTRLVKKLVNLTGITVCLEATGVYVKAYFQHLVDNGKKPLQALCAVMRKLLHAIHGMLKHDKPFDNTRFYAIPA
jgi:hypothetical protein